MGDVFTSFMGGAGIYIAMALLVIAIAVSLIFPLINMFTDFGEAKKALMGVGGLLVLVLIGFALASGELPEYAADKGISSMQFRMIGAMINTALLATAVMAFYLVFDIVIGIVRN